MFYLNKIGPWLSISDGMVMTLPKLLFVLWIVVVTVSPGQCSDQSIHKHNINFISDCKLNKITSKLRAIRTVRRLDTWEDCREECINEEKCSYFRFKVSFVVTFCFRANMKTISGSSKY